MIKCERAFERIFRQASRAEQCPCIVDQNVDGRLPVSDFDSTRFISAKRVRSAKYTEWATPGPLLRRRANVASARDLFRATRTIRAPILASALAATANS